MIRKCISNLDTVLGCILYVRQKVKIQTHELLKLLNDKKLCTNEERISGMSRTLTVL